MERVNDLESLRGERYLPLLPVRSLLLPMSLRLYGRWGRVRKSFSFGPIIRALMCFSRARPLLCSCYPSPVKYLHPLVSLFSADISQFEDPTHFRLNVIVPTWTTFRESWGMTTRCIRGATLNAFHLFATLFCFRELYPSCRLTSGNVPTQGFAPD